MEPTLFSALFTGFLLIIVNQVSGITDCNASQATDVVFMVSSNRFGRIKTDHILKASAKVIESVGSHGNFRYGTIFDKCPRTKDLPVGKITVQSKLTKKVGRFRYSSLASLLTKLNPSVFLPSKYPNTRRLAFLFLESTVAMKDPYIWLQARRLNMMLLQMYVVIIGDGVNRNRIRDKLVPQNRIIHFKSFESLPLVFPALFLKLFCVPTKPIEILPPPVIIIGDA